LVPLNFHFLMFLNSKWHLEHMDNPFSWVYIIFDPPHWISFFVTKVSLQTPCSLLFSLQLRLKNTRCPIRRSFVHKFLGFKIVPLFGVSYTLLFYILTFFKFWNSCFGTWLLDPSTFANFKLPSNSYCCVYFQFLATSCIFWLESLQLSLLRPSFPTSKKFRDQNFPKTILHFLNFDTYIK
jgi:hypothetical protein